jgi:hypothetical protein
MSAGYNRGHNSAAGVSVPDSNAVRYDTFVLAGVPFFNRAVRLELHADTRSQFAAHLKISSLAHLRLLRLSLGLLLRSLPPPADCRPTHYICAT